MASWYIGINRGALDIKDSSIATSTASPSKDIELRIDTGKNTTKKDVYFALDAIRNFIESSKVAGANMPPL